MSRISLSAPFASLFLLSLAACSADSAAQATDGGASLGGTSAQGGSGTGGAASGGAGAAGAHQTGGTTAAGGSAPGGATAAGGSSPGGATTTGGTGGATAAGGSPGGAPAAGGSPAGGATAAGGSPSGGAPATGGSSTGGTSTTGGSGGSSGGGGGSGGTSSGGAGGSSAGDAVVRVHYPAAAGSLTIRGSGGGLSWTQGTTLSAAGDVWSVTLPSLSAPIEWKPLLGDATWALGPNYHVAPGDSLDVYPRFTTVNGKVVTLISSFHSAVLGNDRAIYAYLPPSYDENPTATFPVVYMHDGQNLWAAHPELAFGAPWNVDTTFDQAASSGACSAGTLVGWGAQPLGGTPTTCTGDGDCTTGECRTFPEAIVIGVANDADRIHEYTPTTDPGTPGGGGADPYLQMLVMELKPAIDGMLRTRPDVGSTTLSGSSLGGLVSAYGALHYPGVFGGVAELSPSSWWNNDVIVADIMATLPAPMRPARVYVDSGAGTADDQADTDMLAAGYLALGYVDGVNFRHVVQTGASHSEVYWAQRFPGAMQLVLGPRQ